MAKDNFLEKFSYVMMKIAKFFLKLAIFCVVIYLLGIRLFDFGYSLFYEKSMTDKENEKEVVFSIKKDDTVDDIATNLVNEGLIDDEIAFKFRAKIYKISFTPNVYNLKTSMTIKNMLDIFDSPTDEDIASTVSNEDVYQLSPEGEDENEETKSSEE